MGPVQILDGIEEETHFLFHQHLKYRADEKDLKGISVEMKANVRHLILLEPSFTRHSIKIKE